jgi:misacylated tRNA(Ala) deacylase
MTEELFRADAYLKSCEARVTAVDGAGIRLDRTVFYVMGGGQPGDSGTLALADGRSIRIADTRKGPVAGEILHVPAPDQPVPEVGDKVTAGIDWDRRYRHMRVHTSLHLLSAVVTGGVTGGQIGDGKGRLDFDLEGQSLDKEAIETKINELIRADHPVGSRWITDEELAAKPELVKTMSVKPPIGQGKVRLMDIPGVDLQPCGGTHVARTGEIGRIVVTKIESKGKRNRRVNVQLADESAMGGSAPMPERPSSPWSYQQWLGDTAGDAVAWIQKQFDAAPSEAQTLMSAMHAEAEAPVIWLLGKVQSGKTSIVANITGEGRDEIGSGYEPATLTARKYAWPKERPLLRFLDTRGLSDQADYDPTEDIAYAEGQAHLVLVVVRAEDMALSAVLEPLQKARKRHPEWPVLVAQTRLHDCYPRGFKHVQPWPFGDPSLPGVPDDLRRVVRYQQDLLSELPGNYAPRFVPLDFTREEDEFQPLDYGAEQLIEAFTEALPQARDMLLGRRPSGSDATSRAAQNLIVSYSIAAATAAAVPLPGFGIVGPAVSQSLMLYALAKRYGLDWTTGTWTKFGLALGTGVAGGFGLATVLRELFKLIPGLGQVASGAASAAAGFAGTYALGVVACRFLVAERDGVAIPEGTLSALYAEELRNAFRMRDLKPP